MKLTMARVLALESVVLLAIACSSDLWTGPDNSPRPYLAPTQRTVYPPAREFLESNRFEHHGKRLTNGACLFENSERLARGQRSSLRIVELDPVTCDFVVAKGQRIEATGISASTIGGTVTLTSIRAEQPAAHRLWLTSPRLLIQCGDPGADPSCNPPPPPGSTCSTAPCDVFGGGSSVAASNPFQDVYALDPWGIQVNEDVNRVSFTWDTRSGCIINATVTHGFYYLGTTGWYYRYIDGYKYPISCGSAGGETMAGYSNDRFCSTITGGIAGPTRITALIG